MLPQQWRNDQALEINFLSSQIKVEKKSSGVWNGQIYQYMQRPTFSAILLVKQILPNFGN
jgi:hypothetical protein